ncbi:unnamed protein product [Ectocarpus sp. 12 AP-2014]
MEPGRLHSSSGKDSGTGAHHAGAKRPRTGASIAPPSTTMPPPQPKPHHDQHHHHHRPSKASSSEAAGERLTDSRAVAEVSSARHHALRAISVTLSRRSCRCSRPSGVESGDNINSGCDCCSAKRPSDGPVARQQQQLAQAKIFSLEQQDSRDTIAFTTNDETSNTNHLAGTWTARAITVSQVLYLRHGATSTATRQGGDGGSRSRRNGRDGRDERMSTSRDTGVQATRVGGDDEGKAAAVEVVVGVLSFESLKEGDVAVSSLFVKDETGSVRLVCAPPPPPSWLGQVVCLTRWTLTRDKTPTAAARCERDGSHSVGRGTRPSSSSSRVPLPSFTACLEVTEMCHLAHEDGHNANRNNNNTFKGNGITNDNDRTARADGFEGCGSRSCGSDKINGVRRNVAGDGISRSSDEGKPAEGERKGPAFGGGGGGQERNLEWSCVPRASAQRPTLSQVLAQGALGLDAFVGRKGRGSFDVVARVAAVSPVIRFKNASPFFMVEVEQAEPHQTRQSEQREQEQEQQQQRHPEGARPPVPPPSSPPEAQRTSRICRSPEEISALFPFPTSGDHAGAPIAASGAGDQDEQRITPQTPVVEQRPAPAAAHSARNSGAESGDGVGVDGGEGREGSGYGGATGGGGGKHIGGRRQQQNHATLPPSERQEQQRTELTAMLVLNGQRCLSWQAFLVPGKTFVFPQVGVFVLGGSRRSKGGGSAGKPGNTYRAFGDGARSDGRGGAGGTSRTPRLLVEVDARVSGPGGNSDVHDGHGGDDTLALGRSHSRSQSTTASAPPPSGTDELPARITRTVESIPGPRDQDAEERAGSGKRRRVTGGSSCSGAVAIGRSSSGRDSTGSSSTGGDGRKCGDVGLGGGGNGGGVLGDGDGDNDEGYGGDGACGGVHVLTYEGTITGLGSQAGTYVFDGGNGRDRDRPGINLYLQLLCCSSLGAGLRRGANVRVHNVHPVYAGAMLIGLGACLRTTVQVLRFSPLGENASYRPLTGGPTPLPLAVHAWRHSFNAVFLRKELRAPMPRQLQQQKKIRNHNQHQARSHHQHLPQQPDGSRIGVTVSTTSLSVAVSTASGSGDDHRRRTPCSSSSSSSAPPRGPTAAAAGNPGGGHASGIDLPRHPPSTSPSPLRPSGFVTAGQLSRSRSSPGMAGGGASRSGGETKGGIDTAAPGAEVLTGGVAMAAMAATWEERVRRWVLGQDVRAMRLPKRDVYAEFLNHPPGVCGIIDPVNVVDVVGPAHDCSDCGSCRRNMSTIRGQEEESAKTPKSGFYQEGGCEGEYGSFTSAEDGSDGEAHILSDDEILIQCADEGWHGDSHGHKIGSGGANGHCSRPNCCCSCSSCRPSPEDILRAASRSLSESLQVAVEHAADLVPSIMSRSILCGDGGGGGNESYARSTGGKTAVARASAAGAMKNATFTVRTPFGSRADRAEGLLAWLHIPRGDKREQAKGEAAPAAAAVTTAVAAAVKASTMESSLAERPDTVAAAVESRKRPSGDKSIHDAPSLRPSSKDDHSASARARDGSDAATNSSLASTQACLWLEDRTARARVVLLAAPRPSGPGGATGAAGCAHASARVVDIAAGPELAEVVSGAGRHSDDCDGDSQLGGQTGCDQGHPGRGDAGVSADDTLALVRKYAFCTEVVVLGPAGSPGSTKAPAKTAAPKDPSSLVGAASSGPPATTAKTSVAQGGVPQSSSFSKNTASPSPTHSSPSGGGGGGGGGASSYPRDGFRPPRTTSSPGDTGVGYTIPCETVRVVDGVRVLMRSYLVVEAKDVSLLPGSSYGKNSRTSGSNGSSSSGGRSASGGIERNKRDEETNQRHCLDYVNAAAGTNLGFKHQHHGTTSGADEQTVLTGTKGKQKERDLSPRRPLVPQILSVSEALIVQLAAAGASSSATDSSGGVGDRRGRRGGGGGGGPKLASGHERESIMVRGLLRDVSFRTVADGGGDGRRREKVLPVAVTAVKGQGHGIKGDLGASTTSEVDMFEVLSEERVQLCLTLEHAADNISVYLGVSPEAWPVGMVPGFCTVQVEGVCRRLSGNGKSVYLAVARAGGGTVRVLSLALPPPPENLPALGRSTPPHPPSLRGVSSTTRLGHEPGHVASMPVPACQATTATAAAPAAAGSGRASTTFMNSSDDSVPSDGVGYTPSSAPLLLFPRPRTRPVTSFARDDADHSGINTSQRIRGSIGGGVCSGHESVDPVVMASGRGVIRATRGGRVILLDTHPADAPPSPSPNDTISCDGGDNGASVADAAAGSWACPGGNGGAARKRARVGDGSVPPSPLSSRENTSAGRRAPTVPVRDLGMHLIPKASSKEVSTWAEPKLPGQVSEPVLRAPPRSVSQQPAAMEAPGATSSASPTLGTMFKRGILVRATTNFSCLSVVGVRFAKAATWCNNCGPVRDKDLSFGQCWGRCDVSSNWEVRWEGSANIDDGTAQALVLLDGEDVVKLLKLSTIARNDIEEAARRHGPVTFSGQSGGHSNSTLASAVGAAPPPALAQARAALAAAAGRASCSSRAGHVSASCVQTFPRGGGSRGGGYGSAVVDVMGEGMETLTLPKLVLQGSGLEVVDARGEAYAVLARLGEL